MPKKKKDKDPLADPKMAEVARSLINREWDDAERRSLQVSTSNLQDENAALRRELRATQRLFADNNEYLKHLIATKDTYAASQGERIRSLQVELEQARAAAEREKEELAAEAEAAAEGLKDQIAKLTEELDKLTDFAHRKTELEEEMEDLQERMEQQRADAEARERELETRVLEAREHVQQDVARKVFQSQRDMEIELQKRLDQTTVRTIDENNKLNTELHFQSHTSKRLLSDNRRLMREKAEMQQQVGSGADMVKELSRRVRYYEKLFAQIRQKREGALAKAATTSFMDTAAAAGGSFPAAMAPPQGVVTPAVMPGGSAPHPPLYGGYGGLPQSGGPMDGVSRDSAAGSGSFADAGPGPLTSRSLPAGHAPGQGWAGEYEMDMEEGSAQLRALNSQLDAFLASRSVVGIASTGNVPATDGATSPPGGPGGPGGRGGRGGPAVAAVVPFRGKARPRGGISLKVPHRASPRARRITDPKR